MTKNDLIEKVYKDIKFRQIPKVAVEEMIGQAFELICKGVRKTGKFNYPGFGTFQLKNRKGRNGINPQTGESLWVNEYQSITFRPSEKLKEQLK